jgi:spore coat polysaccharide biosynthesis protein SpsF
MRPTTLCVVQARMGSTRLPGKVLQPIGDRPMLRFMLDRLSGLAVDRLVVATSDLDRDDPIAELCRDAAVEVVRGSESDVLSRFVAALDAFPADHVIRLTADCPLSDPRLVESVLATHLERDADYTSNVLPRSFPKGLDVEVVRASVLRTAAAEALAGDEREHVTPFVYRRPERFRLTNHIGDRSLGRERWTVDTAADLESVRRDVELAGGDDFGWIELLEVVGVRCPPGRGELALRPATAADSSALLSWRNADDAVRWSTTGRAVERCEHEAWFGRVLHDAGRRVWIGEVDGVPVGMVRVDVHCGVGTVSVAVDPARRGHGAGSGLLREVQRELRGDCQVRELRALASFSESGIDPTTGFLALTCARDLFASA